MIPDLVSVIIIVIVDMPNQGKISPSPGVSGGRETAEYNDNLDPR